MSEAKPPIRPFPVDFAVTVKEGSIVHFCYQAMSKDPATGEYICILAKTKSAAMRGLRSLGVPEDKLDEAYVQQVALMNPTAIRTQSGGMVALEPKTPIKRKPLLPRVVADILEPDDLI